MDRSKWLALATRAARDPASAAQIASVILEEIDTEAKTAGVAPPDYLYAGAHRFIARVRNLAVEPLPENNGPPIFETANQTPQPIRIPFDSWIFAVSGYAVVRGYVGSEAAPVDLQGLQLTMPNAAEGRSLFSVAWGLDGQVWFGTDGRRRMMAPASTVVGTARIPRPMSWTLRRNQTIQVLFRNLANFWIPTLPAAANGEFPVLAEAAINFHAVNLESP